MADEPADTVSWGGQDGFEIQSEGMENEWYKGGAQEVYDKLDATYVMGESLEVVAGAVTNFVAGAEVSAVAGLSLDLALAPKIEWQPIPFAVELHGLSHWRTALATRGIISTQIFPRRRLERTRRQCWDRRPGRRRRAPGRP